MPAAPTGSSYVIQISESDTPVGYVSNTVSNNYGEYARPFSTTDITDAAQFEIVKFSATDTYWNLIGTSYGGVFSDRALDSEWFVSETSYSDPMFAIWLVVTDAKAQGADTENSVPAYYFYGTEAAIRAINWSDLTLTPHWINPDGTDSGPLTLYYDTSDASDTYEVSLGELPFFGTALTAGQNGVNVIFTLIPIT